MPRAQPHARLVILHGYGDHSGRYVHFMSWMAQRGVACHTFDFRGHGRSAGKRGYVARWHDFIDDFHTFLREGELASLDAPLLVLGHSHGALVLAAAVIDGLNHVAGCILSSPFFKRCFSIPWHRNVLGQLCSRIIPAQPFKSVLQPEWLCHDAHMIEDTRRDPLGLRIATPRWWVTMHQAQRHVMARAGDFRLPLLMLIGGADPIADPAEAQRFFQAAGSTQKTLRIYPEMLHETLREIGREQVFTDIYDWLMGFCVRTDL